MRKITSVIALVLVCVFALDSCATVSGVYFDAVPGSEQQVDVERGLQFISDSTDGSLSLFAAAQPTYEGDDVKVSFGMQNTSSDYILFVDTDMSLYRGNKDENKWKMLGSWDSQKFFMKEQNKAKSRETLARIASAMAVLNSAMGSYSKSTVRTPVGNYSVTTRTYNPASVALTAAAYSHLVGDVVANNQRTLEYLQSTTLFSSGINAGEGYSGNVYIPVDNTSPDYMVRYTDSSGNEHDFVFSRSDREAVLHPWMDQTRDRHSIVYSYSLMFGIENEFGMHGLTYYWSRKHGVGMYTGLRLGCGDSYADGPVVDFAFDFPIGVTYRIFSNTWLTVGSGIGFGTVTDTSYKGYHYYHNGIIFFPIDIGLNFIVSYFDFNLTVSNICCMSESDGYINGFSLRFGVGVAF